MTTRTRPTAVAGSFYPDEPERLSQAVRELLDDAGASPAATHPQPPKAIIVPHAGYRYSGPVAATGYATLAPARGIVERVILAGPAHFARVRGVAVPSVAEFGTPLGPVAVDDDARRTALDVPGVVVDDGAHAHEHSLEVQLPFLTAVLGDVSVLPILVGAKGAEVFAAVVEALWGASETRVVISTDLSHYLDAPTASTLDQHTAEMICRLEEPAPDAACGAAPTAGMLLAARRHQLEVRLLDLRNSADTFGNPERVVGYGAFGLFEPTTDDDGTAPAEHRRGPLA